MIKYKIPADLLTDFEITHIVHQANLYHTFGAGLALSIKKKYPGAYQADLADHEYGDKSRLGSYSIGDIDNCPGKHVINLYSQDGISRTERTTSYDAMYKGFKLLELCLSGVDEVVLGIPYRLGCGLAGGSWPVVEAIITDIFKPSPVQVVICVRRVDESLADKKWPRETECSGEF